MSWIIKKIVIHCYTVFVVFGILKRMLSLLTMCCSQFDCMYLSKLNTCTPGPFHVSWKINVIKSMLFNNVDSTLIFQPTFQYFQCIGIAEWFGKLSLRAQNQEGMNPFFFLKKITSRKSKIPWCQPDVGLTVDHILDYRNGLFLLCQWQEHLGYVTVDTNGNTSV